MADTTTGTMGGTLIAALGSNILITYDLEMLRMKTCLFGHIYDIQVG
jgi:hypothetical protein